MKQLSVKYLIDNQTDVSIDLITLVQDFQLGPGSFVLPPGDAGSGRNNTYGGKDGLASITDKTWDLAAGHKRIDAKVESVFFVRYHGTVRSNSLSVSVKIGDSERSAKWDLYEVKLLPPLSNSEDVYIIEIEISAVQAGHTDLQVNMGVSSQDADETLVSPGPWHRLA